MAKKPIHEIAPAPVSGHTPAARHLLLGGVATACVLGVGLGLWARPAVSERRLTAPPAAAKPAPIRPGRQIQIVVDDRPAPLGAPLEVMPTEALAAQDFGAPAAAVAPAALPPAAELAPTRPSVGLVRVQAVTVAEPEPEPAPAPRLEPRPKADPAIAAAAELKAETAKREAAKLERTRLANAKLAKAKAEKLRTAKLEAARLEQVREAKAEKAAARLEQVREAKADKARAAKAERLAQAKPKAAAHHEKLAKASKTHKGAKARPDAETRVAAAKRSNPLARMVHAFAKVVPHRTEVAQVKARKPVKARQVHVEKAAAPRLKAKGSGPLRLASASHRCLSADPGEALVCGDPRLNAVDRQMTRAYREAEAAGVSTAQLDRQQRRWLAARSAAAREAPWAVHDVYLDRIAELHDMTRDAHSGY